MSTATKAKERPIIFSGPMVKAILDGSKTQTRRVVKPQPHRTIDGARVNRDGFIEWWQDHTGMRGVGGKSCPYGIAGDKLWVLENFRYSGGGDSKRAIYKCDGKTGVFHPHSGYLDCRWRPSIHMPRWASRITLKVTDVSVERLLSITAKGVVAEGFPFSSDLDQFKLDWNTTNAKLGFGWAENPWVWVITFRKLELEAAP